MTNAELIAVLRHYAATPWQVPGRNLLLLAAERLAEIPAPRRRKAPEPEKVASAPEMRQERE